MQDSGFMAALKKAYNELPWNVDPSNPLVQERCFIAWLRGFGSIAKPEAERSQLRAPARIVTRDPDLSKLCNVPHMRVSTLCKRHLEKQRKHNCRSRARKGGGRNARG
jgi:hypothetical protein